MLNVASGILVLYSAYQAVTMILDPISFIGNALSCIGQQLFGAFGGGGGGGSGAPPYPPPTTTPAAAFGSGAACFAAGTPIATGGGATRPIEDLRVGDRVSDWRGGADRVIRVYSREVDHLREVWYRPPDGSPPRRLETTDDHAFWVSDRGWITARKLRIGDGLVMADQGVARVIRNERFQRTARVYNLDVESVFSYFAGGVLVHQRCGEDREDPTVSGVPGQATEGFAGVRELRHGK
jgi:hypothetical protein